MNASEKVYKAVSKIPKGKIATYKQIAKICGIKNPRTVGFYLHKNIDPKTIPCHRVIRSDGQLASNYAFGGHKKQKEILEKEGIKFVGDKINLKKYSYYN
ncbi:MAG: MGMT family protein [bacterium]|nr:MGMT family protein [bacterium]